MKAITSLFIVTFIIISCVHNKGPYKIIGNIEEPQNELAVSIANVLQKDSGIDILAMNGRGSLANLDSLESGAADFAIVDNHSRFSSKVSALIPLYPQVLHILHKRNNHPATLRELLLSGKIFAGIEGSGTYSFVLQIIHDLGLEQDQIKFVDVSDIFQADVIFSFTDLLTTNELRDLTDFQMFSLGDIEQLGKGSLAEGICMRHPQFEPYVISKEVYGAFTRKPVLTIKEDALLVCRSDLDPQLVYHVLSSLTENREALQTITPQLFNINGDFDPRKLNFTLHKGAENYRNRNAPTFIERYADVFSVILSVVITTGSGIYTLSRWQKARKKNKIDRFYQTLIKIRAMVPLGDEAEKILALETRLKSVQEETIQLVVKEKLMADESFSIFLNLSKIVMDEIHARMGQLQRYDNN